MYFIKCGPPFQKSWIRLLILHDHHSYIILYIGFFIKCVRCLAQTYLDKLVNVITPLRVSAGVAARLLSSTGT